MENIDQIAKDVAKIQGLTASLANIKSYVDTGTNVVSGTSFSSVGLGYFEAIYSNFDALPHPLSYSDV